MSIHLSLLLPVLTSVQYHLTRGLTRNHASLYNTVQSERKVLSERSILSLYRHEPSSANNNQINDSYSSGLTLSFSLSLKGATRSRPNRPVSVQKSFNHLRVQSIVPEDVCGKRWM